MNAKSKHDELLQPQLIRNQWLNMHVTAAVRYEEEYMQRTQEQAKMQMAQQI